MSDVPIFGCGCGSGLRPARCCAMTTEALPARDATRHLTPLVERARQALRHDQPAVAEQLCLDVLDLSPGEPGALEVLYRLRLGQGRAPAAETLLRRLVALHPNDAAMTRELGHLLLRRGNAPEAELHARNAVRISPTDADSHHLLGMVFSESHRPEAGEYHYRRALELAAARPPILLANLAWNLKLQGRIAAARELYRESVAAAPEVFETLLGWARTEEVDGNLAAAAELLDRAEALRPGDAGVRVTRAVLHDRAGRYDEAIAVLDSMMQTRGGAAPDPADLLHKGRLLDKLGRYPEAFAAFEQAKRQAREVGGMAYLAEPAQDVGRRLATFFTAKRMRFTPRARPAEGAPQPIFILGFPRSGTTLVEQSLSMHPQIAAAGELSAVNDITQLMPRLLNSPLAYPEALAELWMGDQQHGLELLRDTYLQRARDALAATAPPAAPGWFTDKMPLNETHLGLLALLFPQAPLVHLHRHPLDVVLSMFSHHLTHGFCCAVDLHGIARHYVLVMDLVAHYRAELALRYLPVRYEDLLDDQAGTIAGMLDFIGAPFDSRCLRFEQNPRPARTPSYAQVNETLHARARFRYRHYRAQLAPLLPVLQPTIDRLGYTVEWEAPAALAA